MDRDREIGSKAVRSKETQQFRAKGPLAAQFEDCSQALKRLFAALSANTSISEQIPIYDRTERCLSRLISWGHDGGASSRVLDHRLRRSSKPRTHTLRLLKELHENVLHAIELLPSVSEGLEEQTKAGPSDPSSSSSTQPDSGESIDIPDDQSSESHPENYLEDAEEIVNELANLLPALLEPYDDAVLEPSAEDTSRFELQDSQFAKSAFPKAPPFLAERLVKGNRWRRQYIQRLKEDIQKEDGAVIEGGSSEAPVESLDLPALRKPRKNRSRRLIRGYRKPSTVSSSEAGMSGAAQSTRNTSIFTESRHDPSITSLGSTNLGVPEIEPPKPPVDLSALPFRCPYCCFEVPLSAEIHKWEEKDWISHFYLDLQPYLCTFENCNRAHKLFGVKQEWFQHELDFHRTQKAWFCARSECKKEFRNQALFELHLKTTHCIAPAEISLLVDNCERFSLESGSPSQQACPLCRVTYKDSSEWKDHIGHHLEQFALTSIGEDVESGDESDDNGEAVGGKHGGFLVNQFVKEQRDMLASKGSPKELTVVHKPEESNEQEEEANDFTDSSNILGDTGDKHNKEAQDLWENKVQNYLTKQPEEEEDDELEGSTIATVWLHMPERNDDFIGRERGLGKLEEFLSQSGHICVLSGRGGIGKTAIAVEYSYRYENQYSYVFWLEAETSGRLADQYNLIGTKTFALGAEGEQDPLSITLSVRERLGRWEKKWLIVFDNVEDWKDVARYIPRNLAKTRGSVLITTRQQSLIKTEVRTFHRIELDPMTSDESSQFLLCTIYPKLNKEDAYSHPDYEIAKRASDLVERLPLALIMVAGYITVSKASLDEFLEIWEEKQKFRAKQAKRSRLITEGALDSSIDLLWDIGISELSVNARNLLEILSFLDPENIPQDLLVGDHNEEYLEFLNSTEASLYKRMIRQLKGQKLIDVKTFGDDGPEFYSIHRLLQQKIVIDIGAQLKFDSAMRKATRLVRKKFPQSPVIQAPTPENWPKCKEYMPHVFSLLRAFQDAQEQFEGFEQTKELAELFLDAGFYVWDRQATEYDGLAFLNAAESILDYIKVDPNSELRADIHCMSGLLRNSMGCRQREDSLRHLELARNIRQHIFTENPYDRNNDVLLQNAATDYGILLLNKYDFTEAEAIFEDCLKQYRVWGSEEEIPFEYSKYYYNTGVVRMWQERMDEAIQFLQRSVELAKAYRGEEGQYWDNQFTLACVILQSGDVQKALDLHLETLSAKLDLFGKHSKSTILSTYAVGAMYYHIGDLPTAIDYMERCIEIATSSSWTEEALGRAQYQLSRLYKLHGVHKKEAEEFETKALEVLNRYSEFVSDWVRETEDPVIMYDDLQPTDEGRFTGKTLLGQLWKRRSDKELVR